MNDKKMYELLTKFANDNTLAEDIDVHVSANRTSLKAKDEEKGAKYEDAQLLSELIRGAEHFLFWVRRNKIKL